MTYLRVATTVVNRIRAIFQERQLRAGKLPMEVQPLYVEVEGAVASISTEEEETPLLLDVVASVAGSVVESESPFTSNEPREHHRFLSRWANR